MSLHKETLIHSLYEIGAVKFGEFTLKCGQKVPIYFDLRRIVSYPTILKTVSAVIWEKIQLSNFDLVCGVPYTALPIATCISLEHQVPMVMRRKEIKNYGTKQQIEGVFQTGQTCLIIEDVITTGRSILETKKDIEAVGLICTDVAILIDREADGKINLEQNQLRVHVGLTFREILKELLQSNRMTQEERNIALNLFEKKTA